MVSYFEIIAPWCSGQAFEPLELETEVRILLGLSLNTFKLFTLNYGKRSWEGICILF